MSDESLYPRHASITRDEMRDMWWTDQPRWHDAPFGFAAVTSNAMQAARDAATAFLEGVRLTEEVTMEQWCWDYWKSTLGEYSSTLPSGTRIGKRWVSVEGERQRGGAVKGTGAYFIGTYTPSKEPNTVGIVWTRVKVVKDGTA